MHKGIIRSALAKGGTLELDYREPSAEQTFTQDARAPQALSEEFASVLRLLCPGAENLS